MEFEATFKATRAEIVHLLEASIAGWEHDDKPTLAGEARRAIARLDAGAWSARVGHIVYLVTD